MPFRPKPLPHLPFRNILYFHTALNNREKQTAFVDANHPASPVLPQPPKLLDQVRHCIRDKHYSLRTEEAYVYWIRWYIRFPYRRDEVSPHIEGQLWSIIWVPRLTGNGRLPSVNMVR